MHSVRLNPMELSFLLVGKVESSRLTEFILICAKPVTEISPSLTFLSRFLTLNLSLLLHKMGLTSLTSGAAIPCQSDNVCGKHLA